MMDRLSRALAALQHDAGPHSLTRPVARFRLLKAAHAGEDEDAIAVLAAMNERGALMALARDEAPHAALATEALAALPPP